MVARRGLVLVNGIPAEIPVGDTFATRKPLVLVNGIPAQLPAGESLATKRALVLVNGVIAELPIGDTLLPASGISFVGSKTFTHSATSAQSVSLTDLKDESNNNATLQQNDLVLVSMVYASVTDRSSVMPISGYTGAHTALWSDDTADATFLAQYKFMGASPDSTVTIPAVASGYGIACTLYAFRGVDTVTPLDVTPVTATGINTSAGNCPAITPATAGAWIVGVAGSAGSNNDGSVWTAPAGVSAATNHFRSASTASPTVAEPSIGTFLKTDWVSGSFDAAAFGNANTDVTGAWAAVALALRPAA